MKYLILFLFIMGCSSEQHLRIGEHVSNGLCSGWITGEDSSTYRISPWKCKEVEFNFVWVPKEQVYSIEK